MKYKNEYFDVSLLEKADAYFFFYEIYSKTLEILDTIFGKHFFAYNQRLQVLYKKLVNSLEGLLKTRWLNEFDITMPHLIGDLTSQQEFEDFDIEWNEAYRTRAHDFYRKMETLYLSVKDNFPLMPETLLVDLGEVDLILDRFEENDTQMWNELLESLDNNSLLYLKEISKDPFLDTRINEIIAQNKKLNGLVHKSGNRAKVFQMLIEKPEKWIRTRDVANRLEITERNVKTIISQLKQIVQVGGIKIEPRRERPSSYRLTRILPQ